MQIRGQYLDTVNKIKGKIFRMLVTKILFQTVTKIKGKIFRMLVTKILFQTVTKIKGKIFEMLFTKILFTFIFLLMICMKYVVQKKHIIDPDYQMELEAPMILL